MAPVVETAAALPAALPAPRRKAGCWTVFATLFFFATLLLVAGLGVAGWLAWSRLGDFETELTGRVRADLEKKGIYLDYGDWGYQFPRGLVFDEVTIFDDATRERPLVKASGVGLNVDLLALAKSVGELRAGEINLQDSSLSLFEAGNLVTTIEGIDGEILAGNEEVRVDRLSALLGGWRVTLNGTVTLPQASGDSDATSASADGEAASAPLALDFSAFKVLEPWLALGGGEGNAPALDLTFAMDADQPDLATIEGTILGREVVWQGVDIASVTATFNVVPETGELSVPSFQIGYGQGFIGGRLAVDTATQRLRIEQLQSTVDVLALLGQYKPAWVEGWKSVRLVDAPSFQLTGEIPFEDPAQAELKVRYDHRQGLVVATEKGELPLRDLRGNFSVSRGSVETNDAGFELFGGSVMLNGATRLTDEARPFNGLIEITGLSLEKAAAFFGKDGSGMSGRLSFVFRGVGYSDIAKIRGGGTLRVEEAVIPDFPVLGQLQDYVGRAVPAFGVKGQGNLNGAYIIESGVLVASDLTVANTAARIVTNGSVNLVSYETDFTARAELVPSLASATGLTEKAITFAGKGPISAPAVALKSFPIEFASVSLGSILGTSPRSLATLQVVPWVEYAVAAFADQLGGPGVTIHPEVTTFFKSLLGEEAPAPEESPAPPQEE
jgi:large exoprotein involved in heme utilization and adhesion